MHCTVNHASSLNIHQLAKALGSAEPDHILLAAGGALYATAVVPEADAVLSRRPLVNTADALVTRGLRRSLEAIGAADLTGVLLWEGKGGALAKPVAGGDAATTAQHVINMQKIVTSAQELLPLLERMKGGGKAAVQLALSAWRAGLSGPQASNRMQSAARALVSGTEPNVERAWKSVLPAAVDGKHSGKAEKTGENIAEKVADPMAESAAADMARKVAEHKAHESTRALVDLPASSSTRASSSVESKSSQRHDDVAERIAALGVAGKALTDDEPKEGRRDRWAPFLRLACGFTASQMACASEAARLDAFISASQALRQSVPPVWAGMDLDDREDVLSDFARLHAKAFGLKPVEVTIDVSLKGERWAFTDEDAIRVSGAPEQRGYDFAQVLWNLVVALTHSRHASLVRDAQAGRIGTSDPQLARLADILVATRSGVVNKTHLQAHVGHASAEAGKLAILLPSWVQGASDADKVLWAQVTPSLPRWLELNPPRLDRNLRRMAEKADAGE